MANYIFFDLEATHKYWNYAHILQIGYLKLNSNLDVVEVYNQYLLPEDEVPPSSSAIHGLTRNKLQFLSKGVVFEDISDRIFEVFNDPNNIIAGYNSRAYDIPLLQRELDGVGCEKLIIPEERSLDLLPLMRKKLVNATSRTLTSATAYVLTEMGIKMSDLNKLFTEITGSTDTSFHGALYDSFMTMTLHLLTKDVTAL